MTHSSCQRNQAFMGLCIALLCAPVGVQAAGLSSVEMPEALRGLNPASSTCKREDVIAGRDGIGKVQPRSTKARPACAVTPAELDNLKADPTTVLVDVRSRPDDTLSGLGGALAMPLSAVGTKSFLRDKTVVLLGNGRGERDLHEACEALMVKGYKRVKLLQGGVPNWLMAQRATSRPLASDALAAADLWAESQFEANLVMLSPRQTALKQHFPAAAQLAEVEPSAVKAQVERWRKEHKQAYLSAVLVVTTPAESDAAQLLRLKEAMNPLPVLVYADTGEAYARYQGQQKAVWDAHARGPRQPGCGL